MLTNLGELVEENFLVGLFADLMDVDVTDDAFLVDENEGAFRHAGLLPKYAVFLRHFSVRPEIGKQRHGDSDVFGPSALRVGRVARDAHDLGIIRRETATVRFVGGKLGASNRRERKREERDDDV